MSRPLSKVAPGWWDYTTLDEELLARRRAAHRQTMSPGSRGPASRWCSTTRSRTSTWPRRWSTSTPGGSRPPDNPAGICGPIGPTEQLPLVARLVNELEFDLSQRPFLGHGRVGRRAERRCRCEPPALLRRADRELCFDRIRPELRMPEANLHFPTGDLDAYSRSYDEVRCVVMQGGQGEVKHWAFNDPLAAEGAYSDDAALAGRVPQADDAGRRPAPDDDHPERPHLRRGQRLHGADQAATVGPVETWKAEKVSIWQAGTTTTRSACG